MEYEVNFLSNYPDLLEDFFKNMPDDEVDAYLKAIYKGAKDLIIANHSIKFPEFNSQELSEIFDKSISYFCTQSMRVNDIEGDFIWHVVSLVHTGKQQDARDLLRSKSSKDIKSVATSFCLTKMKSIAAIGEKFINSDGHKKKKKATKDKHQKIHNAFNKLIDDGVDKSTAYERLENSESLSKRQLQRIIRNYKNDI